MNPARYRIEYVAATSTYHFSFAIEREMRFGCHVVRFEGDGDVDGRDFLIWQRVGSSNPVRPEDEPTEGDLSSSRPNAGQVTRIESTYTVRFRGGL